MQAVVNPNTETIRGRVLKRLKILDTPSEDRFDRLTRKAAEFFDVPFALISFIDGDRQWFKSSHGLSLTQTPREIAFCDHAIQQHDVFIVEDTSQDSRFSNNPLVVNVPNIRFYAGMPISPFVGVNLGTICILDTEPRQLSEDGKKSLKDLAKHVSLEIMRFQDKLTGHTNREGFSKTAQAILESAQRDQLSSTLAIIDFKGLTAINDTHGKTEGDAALRKFSTYIEDAFSDCEIISRIGEDKFCVLASDFTKEDAQDSLDRLKTILQHENQQVQKEYQLAFTAGVVDTVQENTMNLGLSGILNFAFARLREDKVLNRMREREASNHFISDLTTELKCLIA